MVTQRYTVLIKDEYTGDQTAFGPMSRDVADLFFERLMKHVERESDKVLKDTGSYQHWSVTIEPLRRPTVKQAKACGWTA